MSKDSANYAKNVGTKPAETVNMENNPKRSLCLNSDINERSSMDVVSGISELCSKDPESPITLFITSTGGNVCDAFALYEYLAKISKPNLQTVVLGEASSSAVIIFLLGNKRFMGEIAVMRFHRFSFTPSGSVVITAKSAEKIARNLKVSEKNYTDIILQRTEGKVDRKMAIKLLDREITLSAKQAVKLGFAHEIL